MVDSGTRILCLFPSKARLHYYVVFLSKSILALTLLQGMKLTFFSDSHLRGLLCWRRRPDQTNKEVLSSYPDCGFLGKDFQFPQWLSQTHINKLYGHLKNLLVGRSRVGHSLHSLTRL